MGVELFFFFLPEGNRGIRGFHAYTSFGSSVSGLETSQRCVCCLFFFDHRYFLKRRFNIRAPEPQESTVMPLLIFLSLETTVYFILAQSNLDKINNWRQKVETPRRYRLAFTCCRALHLNWVILFPQVFAVNVIIFLSFFLFLYSWLWSTELRKEKKRGGRKGPIPAAHKNVFSPAERCTHFDFYRLLFFLRFREC